MKKQFAHRARLVVYIEAADLNKLTAKATETRQLVSEYVRDVILEKISANSDTQNVRRPSPVRLVESGARPLERTSGTGKIVEPCIHGALPALCRYEECRRKAGKR